MVLKSRLEQEHGQKSLCTDGETERMFDGTDCYWVRDWRVKQNADQIPYRASGICGGNSEATPSPSGRNEQTTIQCSLHAELAGHEVPS
jgi:hypothetical protein